MKDILELVKEKVMGRLKQENLLDREIFLKAKVLSTQEAIGNPENYDFPLMKGKERIVEADFQGHKGQAFTDMYGGFRGHLKEVLEMDPINHYRRALQVATINALTKYWRLVENTTHCKDIQPYECAKQSVKYIKEHYPKVSRIAFIGYQPALLDLFAGEYVLKVLDLDRDNIGKERYGNIILDGKEYLRDVLEWVELALVTGSTLINGTIDDIYAPGTKEKIIFYGVSISGTAYLLGLKRICFS